MLFDERNSKLQNFARYGFPQNVPLIWCDHHNILTRYSTPIFIRCFLFHNDVWGFFYYFLANAAEACHVLWEENEKHDNKI